MKFHGIKYLLITALVAFVYNNAVAAIFPYHSFTPIKTSPSEDIYCVYFDSDGLLWIGSDFGLKSYDGYSFKSYKSDAYTPGILPNNTVRSITEDGKGRLWIGTLNGLVCMNKHAGTFRTYHIGSKSAQTIYTLYTSPDGTVWMGTDGGLSYYDEKTQRFHTYDNTNSWILEAGSPKKRRIGEYSVKAILQDSNGDIIIGTWDKGLMRLPKGSSTFLQYPKINDRNSAYSLYLDGKKRLWVGSWGNGVMRIDNPRDLRHAHYKQYPYKTNYFDIFQKFVEDKRTQTLWACTREGLCSLNLKDANAQWQQYTQIGTTTLSSCCDIAKDKNGYLWVATQNSGIIQTTFYNLAFQQWQLGALPQGMALSYVYSLFTTDGNHFWLGLNPYGVALYDRSTGKTLYNSDIPGFKTLQPITLTASVSGIAEGFNGEIWFAVNSYGVIIYKNGKTRQLITTNTPYLWEDFVNTVFKSRDNVMWIGTRSGLNAVFPNGRGRKICMKNGSKGLIKGNIKKIIQDKNGKIWIATINEGIIRLSGNIRKPKSLKFRVYSPAYKNFPVSDASACLCDRQGRLWAISNSGGLFLYNPKKDCFEAKDREYHLPGNRILSINEDEYGNLWMSTDDALIRLSFTNGKELPDRLVLAKEAGMDETQFAMNSTAKYGNEIFFGSHKGFISFRPSSFQNLRNLKTNSKLIVTDILVDDVSLSSLDSAKKTKMADFMPPYTRKLTVPADAKTLKIDFSLLTYGDAERNSYAYKLDGYDDKWHFVGNEHSVSFQSLPAGSYKLELKATDGKCSEAMLPYTFTIRILAPWYASWWAYIIYILLAMAAACGVIYWYRERLRSQNRMRTSMMLTNITHELMTPLTVVSATIHKLRSLAPQYDDDYKVIDNNMNRTTRLLRQILEVRKSQAGQLKLKVSRQDIAAFVSKEAESVRPMALENNLSFEVNVPDKEIPAWFDRDKLDKILYNLISNAIKYNKKGGKVLVSMTTDKDYAVIKVQDTGIGMSRQQQRHLYTRFFDGDYRKQNITGTGIGLALVHDLVKLHHAKIECQSKENAGTVFTVTLPIRKGAYDKNEIDTSTVSSAVDRETVSQIVAKDATAGNTTVNDSSVAVKPKRHPVPADAPVVLVVEDNDELLELMRQVLSRYYHVLTAKNGKQAWNIIQKEKLDLVVTDVMMPIMDGMELLHAIKSDKDYWQLPVILLTAKAQEEDKKEGYAAGADGYIVKPFNFDELVIRVNAIISNRKKAVQQNVAKSASADDETESKTHASNPDKVFIDKAEACVRKHIDDSDFDRDTFAQEMLVSSSTLYNRLRSLTGKTIIEFINDIRLEEAHRIQQEDPHITFTELSSRVGFNTPKYFSRLYRKKFPQKQECRSTTV